MPVWAAKLRGQQEMARANRHHLPGYVWHITHRCHKREFLLKFDKDKKRWVDWLFEAKKRFGLSILDYAVTSNHIHLLVFDSREDVIPKSIQLIAGRTGREYNQRKKRRGAFWEDRYHATAIKKGDHLARCLVYIDLNMVRAGAVQHPSEWVYGGYNEIQGPKKRYTLIDRRRLAGLIGIKDDEQLSATHSQWVQAELESNSDSRDPKWTRSIAVGDEAFVRTTQSELGGRAIGRKPIEDEGVYELREAQAPYSHVLGTKKVNVRHDNSYLWELYVGNIDT